MRRAISSATMALAVLALFLGNCFSCPEMLLSAHQAASAHSCCHPHQPKKVVCQNQGLQSFEKVEPASAPVPLLAAALEPVPAIAAFTPALVEFSPLWIPPEPAPPDPLSLTASFRV